MSDQIKETTQAESQCFILLSDFWEGFRLLEARHDSAESFIRTRVQNDMYVALRKAMPKVTILPIDELRLKAISVIRPDDEFVVTLDGGILFPSANFRIEITRAADSIQRSICGPYMRVARGMTPQLRQQAINLRAAYSIAQGKPIVLCDDGIGTGTTIKSITDLLKQVGISVTRIITITNPKHVAEIDGIPITTIHQTEADSIWLNERDLYWGLPRSGLSVHRANQFVAIGGVPYTLSNAMATNRIGLPEIVTPAFRRENLTLNKLFWKCLEDMHGRSLTLKDCSRLQFFGEHLSNTDLSIVDLIEQTESGELLRRLGFDE